MSGIKLAILYGIKPYELGFCGPEKKKNILSDYLKGKKIDGKELREFLKEFKGAYPYYKLIAKANNIKDPFDEKIVRAYWIGNKLLERMKKKAHHSFHVLIIGSVTGRIELKGELLDICRVSWGKVIKKGKKIIVEYQPFVGTKELKLGKPIKKEIDWNKDLLLNVKTGDWISFHWNQAVEVLNKEDVKNLEKYTKNSIEIYNKLNS